MSTAIRIETATRGSRLFLLLLGLVVIAAMCLPAVASRSLIKDLFLILTLLSLAQCWNLLAGYGGLVSVGQQAFVGLGAYALFAGISLAGVDPLLSILIGGVAAVIIAIPAAFFLFRLDGAYFAIGSWVIAEVVRLSIAQWKALGGGTGTSLPRDAIREMACTSWVRDLFGVSASAARDILLYWCALAVAALFIGVVYALLRNRIGLGLSAVRDNTEAAESVGIHAGSMKWMTYLIAAFGTGITGALIFLQKARISPDAAFSVTDWTAFVIFVVVNGGIGTIEGPIIGVLVFFLLQNLLADFGTWYLIALGLAGIITMLFAPQGLWGLMRDRLGVTLFPIRRRVIYLEERTKP
ncbi:branched-chain amino acid ABC transporter permease [Ruegeria sp. EL01]|jgi:branched-chain amino acid transport system permease protein|uniref:branched-chain amino acid ABC transporter permease n=1 Tax=Ruegeria sp. EL01 TaxID=2107578 RepID=UPI000EA83398|nr:branched-chain amino acid ABC transporter permease [Ruegeria sp. EL01]